MEVIAKSKFIRTSPRKIRLVADAIRGMKVEQAVEILKNINKRAAKVLLLVLKQGTGNAVNNFKLDKSSLLIKKIEIGKGPTYKRGRPVSRGQWHSILKRTSHITIVLEGEEIKPKSKKKEKSDGAKS